MNLSPLLKQAITHTRHCLIGCGIGEVTGMMIGAALGWSGSGRIILSIALAFLFGYALTYRGVRKNAGSTSEAVRITLATDTVSITTMEIVDNSVAALIPGALMAGLGDWRFWWSLIVALGIAFWVTVPVNYALMRRSGEDHHHMHH